MADVIWGSKRESKPLTEPLEAVRSRNNTAFTIFLNDVFESSCDVV